MLDFKKAARRHSMFKGALERFNDRAMAQAIWSGVCSSGDKSLYGQAVADTAPRTVATLVATDDIACCFATALHMDVLSAAPARPATPHEARTLAHAAWKLFEEVLAGDRTMLPNGPGGEEWALPFLRQPDPVTTNNEKLREIADLAGRMYKLLKGKKANRVKDMPEEVIGVEQGGDAAALVSEEYALWKAGAASRADLLVRIEELRATMFEREGRETKGRGPLVVALDQSGSMTGPRDTWAKAAMTALTRLAWEEKRPVKVVAFSTATRVFELPPGSHAMLKKVQLFFLNGGTDIGVALRVSADEVEEWAKAGIKNADVVLVSDGGDGGSTLDKSVADMLATGVRLFSVAIDCEFEGALREKASEYVFLNGRDMHDASSVGALAGAS
jgi:Mg-chelatase subunit ChlD